MNKEEDEDKKQTKDEVAESLFETIIEIPSIILEVIGDALSN